MEVPEPKMTEVISYRQNREMNGNMDRKPAERAVSIAMKSIPGYGKVEERQILSFMNGK